jgi:hypothetical protein
MLLKTYWEQDSKLRAFLTCGVDVIPFRLDLSLAGIDWFHMK